MQYGRWLAAALFVATMFALDRYGPSVGIPPGEGQQQSDYYSSGSDSEVEPEAETSDDRLADYTEWLVYLTGVLSLCAIAGIVVSRLQWIALRAQEARLKESIDKAEAASATQSSDMKDSIAVAQRAVKAAEMSAKAAVGVSLPFLNVERVTGTTEPDNLDVANWIRSLRPKIVIKNYGNTPAFVIETLINAKITNVLEGSPIYKAVRKVPEQYVIDKGCTKEYAEYLFDPSKAFTEDEITLAATFDTPGWLHVYGYIAFTDYMGEPHKVGFSHYLLKVTEPYFSPDPNPAGRQYQYRT